MRRYKTTDLDSEFTRIAGEVMREKRDKANMTLDDLGKRVRTTKQNLYKYEHGICRYKADIFISLCYAMGEDPNAVFQEIKDRFNETKLM